MGRTLGIAFKVQLALLTTFLAACGGGGGGGGRDTDDVRFEGTVTRTSATTTTLVETAGLTERIGTKACEPSIADVEVCALGSCSTSSSVGAWSFATDELPDDDINFTLTACDFDSKIKVSDIDTESRRVVIDFAISPEYKSRQLESRSMTKRGTRSVIVAMYRPRPRRHWRRAASLDMSIDLAIVLIFVGATLYVGLAEQGKITIEDYWVNGRRTNRYVLIATTLSTFIGAASIFGLASLAYSGAGFAALILPFSYLFYFLVFARFFAPKIKEFGDQSGAYTLPDFFAARYSSRVRLAGAIVNLVTLALYTAVQFVAFGAFIGAVLALNPFLTTIIGGVVAIAYASVGGLRADIRTDVFQFVIMVGLLCVVVPLLFGTGEGFSAVMKLPVEFLRGDQFASPWVILSALLFLGAGTLTSTDLWQRAYAADSKENLRWALSVTAALVLLFLLMGAGLGLFAKALLPGEDPNMVVPALLKQILPAGLYGVVLAGLVAAVMSTVDTLLVVMSMTLVHDFYIKSLNRPLSPEKTLRVSRLVTMVLGLVALLIALAIFSVGHLTIHAVSFYVALLPAVVYGFYGKSRSEPAAFWSIVTGFAVTAICSFVAPVEAFIPGLLASVLIFVSINLLKSRDTTNNRSG